MRREIVITGLGAITPLGIGARTVHDRWSAGVCAIEDGEAVCTDFDATDFLSAKEVRRADRFTQLAITACQEALADAGWAGASPYRPDEIGCILGTGIGGIATIEANHARLVDGAAVSPLAVPLMMDNAGAAALAIRHDLRGPGYGIVSACAAGAHAIGAAARAAAMRDAEVEPDEIDYVNAHGTSTPLNDRAETIAIKRALGPRAAEIPVSSTKSAIGHLLGAAGAVEALATVLALRARVAPPTLGWEVRDPELDLDYVDGSSRPLRTNERPPVALSNSFGFGGHNAVLCLEAA